MASITLSRPIFQALRNRTRQAVPAAALARLNTRPSPFPAPARPFVPATQTRRKYGTANPTVVVDSPPSQIPAITQEDSYDIVIIGGGPAGLALACTLLSKPSISTTSRILLIEGGSLDRVRSWNASGKDEWDNRVSSLTAENVQVMRGYFYDRLYDRLHPDIGAWEHVDQSRSCAVHDMLVWTTPNASSTSQIHFPELSAPMAHLTENINTQRGLLRRIDELDQHLGRDRIRISEGKKVEEMRMGQGGRWVGLRLSGSGTDGENWVRGGVVVGADGYNSPVRKFAGISSSGHAYDTHAVVATLHHEPVLNNHTAFQRFLNTGPIAFLPLGRDAATMVWSTSPELAAAYKKLSVEILAKLVNLGYYLAESELNAINARILADPGSTSEVDDLISIAFDKVLGTLTASDLKSLPPLTTSIPQKSVASFPLKLSHAETYVGDRAVLVGDAAHTVHPLAGQGLNMGLADVESLGDVWEQTAQRGGDFGAYTTLLPYEKERYPANRNLLFATDKMHHLFRNRLPVVNWARSVGMDLVNELGPVKKAFMEQAGARAVSGRAEVGGGGRDSRYGSAANTFDGWLQFKGMAKLVVGAGGEVAKNGARRLLERIAK